MTEPTAGTLTDLVVESRYFVERFDPQSDEDRVAREALLARIDEAVPPPPELVEACAKRVSCFLPNGHEGDCDDSFQTLF